MQYLECYKHQDFDQGRFIKPLQASTHAMKNACPTTADTYLTGRLILNYCLRLELKLSNKINQATFLKFHFSLSKQAKIHISRATQQKVMTLWNFLKITVIFVIYFRKTSKMQHFLLVENMGKDFLCIGYEATGSTLVKITGCRTCYFVLLTHTYATLIKCRRKYQ